MVVSAEFLRHQRGSLWGGGDGRSSVKQYRPCAAGENVVNSAGHLMANGPDDIRRIVWQGVDQTSGERVLLRELIHGFGVASVIPPIR